MHPQLRYGFNSLEELKCSSGDKNEGKIAVQPQYLFTVLVSVNSNVNTVGCQQVI